MFRRRASLFVLLALFGCKRRVQPQPTPPKPEAVDSAASSTSPRALAPDAGGRRAPWGWTEADAHGEHFRTRKFSFRLSEVAMVAVDMRLSRDFEGALTQTAKGLFAINGGFFGTDGAPVGLLVSKGVTISRFSKGMSGGVLTIQDARAVLRETETFDESKKFDFAVQCRPRLVVDAKVNIRGDDGKRSERSALCIREEGALLDAVLAVNDLGGPSLLALAEYMQSLGCTDALNLDGGPSTGAAWRENGSIAVQRPRGPVRHALVAVEN